MFNDILTMMWKEWREVILNRRGMRGGLINIGVVLLVLGVFMPMQVGRTWLNDPKQLLVWSWLPIFIALSVITDAFAGERERHTLETLLASRLSDQAILFGKILAVVLYAWLLAALSTLIGAVTVNVAFPAEKIQFYALDTLLMGLGLSLLAAILVSCIGVLVSLRAPTARQAYQRMSVVLIAFWFLPMMAIQFMSQELKVRLFGFLAGVNLTQIIVGAGVFLIAADIVLLFVVNKSFRRSRLILA
jgi:ABC-2 type transport system permease protein